MEEESFLNITFPFISLDSWQHEGDGERPYFNSFSVVNKGRDTFPLASTVAKNVSNVAAQGVTKLIL